MFTFINSLNKYFIMFICTHDEAGFYHYFKITYIIDGFVDR